TQWDTREVFISSTNEKTAAIDEQKSEQLREGESIVMNPRKHLALFDPNKLPKEQAEQPRMAGSKAEKKGPAVVKDNTPNIPVKMETKEKPDSAKGEKPPQT